MPRIFVPREDRLPIIVVVIKNAMMSTTVVNQCSKTTENRPFRKLYEAFCPLDFIGKRG